MSTLRDFGFGKRSMEGRIMEEVDAFVDCVKSQQGQAFDISDLLHISISNVISYMVFGKRFQHDDQNFRGLMNAVSDNLTNAKITGLLTFLPFLRYIPGDPTGYKHVMRNIENGRKYLERIIDDRKENFDYNDVLCYVDAFLKHRKEHANRESTFTGISFYFLKNRGVSQCLTSPLKPLGGIQRNLTWSKISKSSTSFVFFSSRLQNQDGRPGETISTFPLKPQSGS